MQETRDLVVLFLVLVTVVGWIGYGLKKWLSNRPWLSRLAYLRDAEPPSTRLKALLDEHGYDTLAGKYKFSLIFKIDDQKMKSRLFIDGIARDEEGVYAVKLARKRQPLDWTGSGVRDAFLPLFAVAGPIRGILFVDLETNDVVQIVWDKEGST